MSFSTECWLGLRRKPNGFKMFNFGPKIFLLFLLAFPITLVSIGGVKAESDPSEDQGPDSVVEEEDEDEDEVLVEEAQVSESDTDEDLDEDSTGTDVTSHPDADTTIVFVTGEEFPANEIVKFLVGFTNKGSQDFTVQSLEASFRYPQDYQFYIQNFTALPLSTVVQPQRQASFEYSFIPAQQMAGRPFGLVILLNYLDSEGNGFQSAIYNQTVTIIELDEGLDGETMFMYVFLSGLVALLLFGIYQVLEARTRKRLPVKVETGTGGLNDVDISWIPQETLNVMNKASPKASPRKRTKRAAGTDQ
ncbi:translocon-associated protein subunit alpha-like [Anguilla anguilla]|nr:translocon-associated protein subunit alpha-like [Anguilla anguilla]